MYDLETILHRAVRVAEAVDALQDALTELGLDVTANTEPDHPLRQHVEALKQMAYADTTARVKGVLKITESMNGRLWKAVKVMQILFETGEE